MSTPSNVIRIPKVEDGSFNKNRRVSLLLRTQVTHITEAVKKGLEENLASIESESDAAAYIGKMTAILRLLGTPEGGASQ